MKNYYHILRVGFTATTPEIKLAYHKRAREVHPDTARNRDSSAFTELAEAYRVLSDPSTREEYDAQIQRFLKGRNLYMCSACGRANSIPKIPPGYKPVCASCQHALPVDEPQRRSGERTVLVTTALEVLDEFGGEAVKLAGDALQVGLGHLRQRLGLKKRN